MGFSTCWPRRAVASASDAIMPLSVQDSALVPLMAMRPGWFGLGSLVVLLGSMAVPERHDPPTWARDVAPLVHAQCSPCHSKGGHGPFALETYRDVTRRSELVRQELL